MVVLNDFSVDDVMAWGEYADESTVSVLYIGLIVTS